MSIITHAYIRNGKGRWANYLLKDEPTKKTALLFSSTGATTGEEQWHDFTTISRAIRPDRKVTQSEIMTSYHRDECAPENIERIHAAVGELAATLGKGHQYAIVEHAHADGRREYHICILSVGDNGKILHQGRAEIRKDGRGDWQRINDKILNRHGLGVIEHPMTTPVARWEAEAVQKRGVRPHTFARRRALGQLVRECVKIDRPRTVDDLISCISRRTAESGDKAIINNAHGHVSIRLASWGTGARPVRFDRVDKRWTSDGLALWLAKRNPGQLVQLAADPVRQKRVEHAVDLLAVALRRANKQQQTAEYAAETAREIADDCGLDAIDRFILSERIRQQILATARNKQYAAEMLRYLDAGDHAEPGQCTYTLRRLGKLETRTVSYSERVGNLDLNNHRRGRLLDGPSVDDLVAAAKRRRQNTPRHERGRGGIGL